MRPDLYDDDDDDDSDDSDDYTVISTTDRLHVKERRRSKSISSLHQLSTGPFSAESYR